MCCDGIETSNEAEKGDGNEDYEVAEDANHEESTGEKHHLSSGRIGPQSTTCEGGKSRKPFRSKKQSVFYASDNCRVVRYIIDSE